MNENLSLIEKLWNGLLNRTTDSIFIWHVFGLNIMMALLYWSIGLLYLFMDMTKKPEFLQKYKMNRNSDVVVDRKMMKKLIKQIVYNQIVIGIIFTTCTFPLLTLRGPPSVRVIPTLSQLIYEFYCCWFIREILFYYLHRLAHHKSLYKRVHKKHHRWTAPIALSAEYCTPYEHIMTNLIPTLIGPLIVGTHYPSIFIWFVHVMLSTLQKHSGYDIPWYYNSTRHDSHHQNFKVNYGLIGILDWLHGTNDTKFIKKTT